jgi:hypothetical protein
MTGAHLTFFFGVGGREIARILGSPPVQVKQVKEARIGPSRLFKSWLPTFPAMARPAGASTAVAGFFVFPPFFVFGGKRTWDRTRDLAKRQVALYQLGDN